jgi:type II secretory pathway component GspD/PulD (secretin)
VDWEEFSETLGNFNLDLLSNRTLDIGDSIGFGAQYSAGSLEFDAVAQFLATQGAVKTISQPQITVLSGSDASIRSGTTQSYISEITRSEGFDEDDDISVTTSQLETGLRLTISSAWDDSTVYGNLEIQLDSLVNLDNRTVGGTSIQLPEVNERVLNTRIRVRPGDALIIGGIVSERDDYRREGLGLKSPLLPTFRATQARNSELVFMLRPKVIVFADKDNPASPADVGPQSRVNNGDTPSGDSPDDPVPLSDYLDQLPADLIDPTTPPAE